MTSAECDGCAGGIFTDSRYVDPNRIGILWRPERKLDYRISNIDTSGSMERYETEVLSTNKKYDVAIVFDGSKCKYYLNGDLLSTIVDCSSGFDGMSPSPHLCYDNWRWVWKGSIENLRFDGVVKKGSQNNIHRH